MDLLERSARRVRDLLPAARPRWAVVLGSGWGAALEALTIRHSVDYADIPCLGATQVEGHAGRLHLVESDGLEVLAFQGRRHWYEGEGWEPVAVPVYLCIRFGIPCILLTNAAGGIRDDLKPGDLMVLDDHINAMGVHPLVGPHKPCWGPRFPDQTSIYDPDLGRRLDEAATQTGIELQHGVYAAASGPTYETPAEIRALRMMGADAVGMSTVPEAILANAAGLRVAALSCVANAAAAAGSPSLSHDDVISEIGKAQPCMSRLLVRFFQCVADMDT